MRQIIKRHPVWSFLIINFAISWSFLYPCYRIILESEEFNPLALIGLIGAYGPSIAAIIVQSVIDKKKLRALFRSLIKIKVGFRLLIFTVVIPISLYILSYLIAASFFDGDFSVHWKLGIMGIPIWFIYALPFGPLGEELGWRGFMLPKLLEKYSVLKSTLLVGLAWGVWHLASFTFPGAAIPDFLPVTFWTITLFFINTMALSLVYTYVHFKSDGSVFLAILLHAFFNAASNVTFDFFAETDDPSILISAYVLNMVLAAICGIIFLKKLKILNLN